MLEKFCRTDLGQNIIENLEPLLIFTIVLDSDYLDRLFLTAKIDLKDIFLRFRYHQAKVDIWRSEMCSIYN